MRNKVVIPRKRSNPALEAIKQKRKENMIICASHKANMLLTLMVLHDKFDFSEEELNRFMSKYRKQLDAYNEGYVESVKDFEQVLWDECGIKIEF